MYHDDFAKIFYKLINKKGIINIGGKKSTVFNFARINNSNILKKKSKSIFLDQSMNITKFEKILKK